MGWMVCFSANLAPGSWETWQIWFLDLPRWSCLSIPRCCCCLCWFSPPLWIYAIKTHSLPSTLASGGVVDAPLSFVVMTSLMGAVPCLFRRVSVPCRVSTVQQQWRRSVRHRLSYGARLCLHFMQPPRKVGPRPPVFR